MAEYDEDILGAAEDITAAGELCTWERPSTQADPDKDWVEGNTAPQTIPGVPVAFVPVGRIGFESLLAILGTEVPTGYEQGLMPGNVSFVPRKQDVCIRASGKRMAIKDIVDINPNGQHVLYILTMQEE